MTKRIDTDLRIRDLVGVAGRYRKSVHLERDSLSDQALAGYIVTPLVRSVLSRLANGLEHDATQRAWSVTGPYGTGKSSLAVFWANLLAGQPEEQRQQRAKSARSLITAADESVANRLYGNGGLLRQQGGFVTVLATGERAGLDLVILRALFRSLERFWSGRGAKPSVLHNIAEALEAAEQGELVGARRTVELIEAAAQKIAESSNPGRGLVIIVDEAGKCLEYAAYEPDRGDVQLLQELAEAANRSAEHPILFITILHQSFERYAGRLGATQRNEWAKVQGRFEDIAFQEDTDQLLRLVAAALTHERPLPEALRQEYRRLAKNVAAAVSAGDKSRARRLKTELESLFPLHPVTALILGPLFRTRLAQNERSLFSFLCSGEPLGFQAHIDRKLSSSFADNLYTVDALYDYVVTALGTQLFGRDGRAWAEIDTALRRIPKDSGEYDARTLKTIGLLALIGDQASLRPSGELLELCLGRSSSDKVQLQKSLARLTDSSAIVYRKYRDAYQIWEGSDLDLDDLIRTAHDQLDTRSDLARRLTAIAPPRPIVARRHLFRTGTLRYFEVRYIMADAVEQQMALPPEQDADGTLLLALPRTGSDLGALRKLVSQRMLWFTHAPDDTKPIIVGIPRSANHLSDLAAELGALEWVQSNTADLAKDPVARRELSARIAEADRLIREELTRLMDDDSHDGCEWFYRGEKLSVSSISALGRQISVICDQVYHCAPIVQNELINRRQLSSAAAAARRNLLEAMLERSDHKRLGFEGYPPEVSIYRSLVAFHGLHRKKGNGWALQGPTSRDEGSLKPAWKAIEIFLASTEQQRRTIDELYASLRKPPYGIKDGLLPIIVCAALLHFDSDVALYERGAFVPGLTTPVVERLLRWPDKFELQRFKIAGVRAKVFERFGRALLSGPDADHPTLLAIVRSLVRFIAELPDYARVTKQVSQTARDIRAVLRRAQEPGPLLFRDLPDACGCQPFAAKPSTKSQEIEHFFNTLKNAIRELQAVYPSLLTAVEQSLSSAFDIPAKKTNLRDELSRRASCIADMAAEPVLKAFILRVADGSLPHEEWLVSLATQLATKPPPKWNDDDFERMQVSLTRIARKFRTIEALAIHVGDDDGAPHSIMRLSIARPGAPELERVVSLREEELVEVQNMEKELLDALDWRKTQMSPDAILAALAGVAQSILRQTSIGQEASEQSIFHA